MNKTFMSTLFISALCTIGSFGQSSKPSEDSYIQVPGSKVKIRPVGFFSKNWKWREDGTCESWLGKPVKLADGMAFAHQVATEPTRKTPEGERFIKNILSQWSFEKRTDINNGIVKDSLTYYTHLYDLSNTQKEEAGEILKQIAKNQTAFEVSTAAERFEWNARMIYWKQQYRNGKITKNQLNAISGIILEQQDALIAEGPIKQAEKKIKEICTPNQIENAKIRAMTAPNGFDMWYGFVIDFCQKYNLDQEQTETAMSVLRDYSERRNKIYFNIKPERGAIIKPPMSYQAITEIFNQMTEVLETIPTDNQKQSFKNRESKLTQEAQNKMRENRSSQPA